MSSSVYRSTLKATSIVGGSAVVSMLFGMVKTKFAAILLGPAGVGLMGVYQTMVGMLGTVSSFGIDTSGVRSIAEAQGGGDGKAIARLVKTVVRTAWLTGVAGLIAMVLASGWLSDIAFGSRRYAPSIAALGIAVLLGNVMIGLSCLLQGTRRIAAMAKAGMAGAISGMALSIPCFYLWGEGGIVPALILSSLASLAAMWWMSSRVPVERVAVSWSESLSQAGQLLHFGLPVMGAGMVAACSAYVVRAVLIRQLGLEGVGYWQAAFNLSGLLVNFVLGAMVADYYPRLVAAASDHTRLREVMNAQTEIALLLAAPGLVATIILAPLAVSVFYSGRFEAAAGVMLWFVYGLMARIVAWPVGLVLLAKGMGKTYFLTEAVGNAVYILAVWVMAGRWGLAGAGMAFIVYYALNAVMACLVVGLTSRASWSPANIRHVVLFVAVLVLAGVIMRCLDNLWLRYSGGVVLMGGVALNSMRCLSRKSGVTLAVLRDRFLGTDSGGAG